MTRAVLILLLALSLSACSTGALTPGGRTKPDEASDSRTPTAPRDTRTRAKLHVELGSLYLQEGQLAVALEELLIAISIDPDYAKAYNTRGLAHYYIKEMELAERDFQRALSLEPNDPEVHNNYGWFLCQIGREKEGIAFFQRAIRNPLYATPDKAYLNAGACYTRLGNLAQAEDFVQHSLRIHPDNPAGLLQLAEISYRRGDFALARQQMQSVLSPAEPGADALWLIVRIERNLGNRQAEARYASQLKRRFPLSSETQELLKGNFE